MSRTARWVLGSFAFLFAGIFAFTAPSRSPLALFLPTGFCVLIALACFSQTLRGPATRIIGGVVFLVCVSYLVFEIWTEPTKLYSRPSEPSWTNAVEALIVFGLPGIYVALRGEYPRWGKGAEAFRGDKPSQHEDGK